MSIEDTMEVAHINGLRCCVCKHYLSVKPIVTSIQNGESACGRCVTSFDTFTRNHFFELLASQFIFPCMYAEGGCLVKKPFVNIKNHENSCSYRIHKCHCSWSGNSLELIVHYERNHEELVIKEGDSIATDGLLQLLLISQCLYYFINCAHNSDNFNVEIISLTDNITAHEIVFELNSYCQIKINQIKMIPCREMLPTFMLKSVAAMKSLEIITSSIICPNCNIPMTPPILRCLNGHVTCVECTEAWLDHCQKCEMESYFWCDPELENIAAVSIFSCRWKCGRQFNAHEIREHERSCEKRIYNCCHTSWCKWKGYLAELVLHEKTCNCYEYVVNDCVFIFNQTDVPFLFNAATFIMYHLFIYNCHFDISFGRDDERAHVTIYCKDYCSIGRFRFTIRVMCPENLDFSFNKVYMLKHENPTWFSIKFPEEDILQIGKETPFKIILSIVVLSEEERMQKRDWINKRFKNCSRLLW